VSALPDYQIVGRPDGIPLIFLHGFMGSSQDWLNVTKQLESELFCILIDLPGHGCNRRLLHYGWQETARAISAVMDVLNLRQAGIMGYSMGGRIALYTVLHNQYRFSFLIIESATPGLREEDDRETRRLWEDNIVQQLRTTPYDTFLAQWYAQPLFAGLSNHPEFPQLLARRLNNDPLALATAFQNLATSTQPDLWPLLEKLNIPLLLLAGEKDTKYQQILRRFQLSVPQASWQILNGCGHHIHFEQPERFTTIVRSFIHSVSMPAA